MPDWARASKQAGRGAVAGAVTLTTLAHSYFVLTDSPALRDGQYAMLPLLTGPPGALVGGIIGFIAGAVSGGEESAAGSTSGFS